MWNTGGRIDFGCFRCNVYYSTEVLTFEFIFGLVVPFVEFDVTSIFSIPFIISGILFVRVARSDSILAVGVSVGAVSCVFRGISVTFLV